MSNLSKIIELVEYEFGAGKAQLISDLLDKPDFVPVEGREDVCQALEDVHHLTVARDSLIEELPEYYSDVADKLAGGFYSLGDAIAKVEVEKRQEDTEAALQDELCSQVYCME